MTFRLIYSFSFALVLVASALMSCKKDTVISGRVYNAITNVGVDSSTVVFVEKVTSRNPEGKQTTFITGADGRFQINKKINQKKIHKIIFPDFPGTNNYLLTPYEVSILKKGDSHEFNMAFVPYRNVTIQSFYLPEPIVIRDLNTTFPDIENHFLLDGWNYFDLQSRRADNTVLTFRDSLYIAPTSDNIYEFYRNY
jgi:hypothetical protein